MQERRLNPVTQEPEPAPALTAKPPGGHRLARKLNLTQCLGPADWRAGDWRARRPGSSQLLSMFKGLARSKRARPVFFDNLKNLKNPKSQDFKPRSLSLTLENSHCFSMFWSQCFGCQCFGCQCFELETPT